MHRISRCCLVVLISLLTAGSSFHATAQQAWTPATPQAEPTRQSPAQQTVDPAARLSQTAVEVWSNMIERGEEGMNATDYVTAEKNFRESLTYAEQHNLSTAYVAKSTNSLGWSLRSQRRYAEAEVLHRAALQMNRSIYPENDQSVTGSKVGLGIALTGLGRYDEAERLLLEAVNTYDGQPQVTACTLSSALDGLAMLYKSNHQYSKGERIYTEVFALMAHVQGTPCQSFVSLLDHLAELYADDSQWDRVEKIQRGRADLALGMEGPQSVSFGDAIFAVAQTLEKRQRHDDAQATYAQAAEIYRHTAPPEYSRVAISLERQEINLYFALKPEQAKKAHQAMLAASRQRDAVPGHNEVQSLHSRIVEARQAGKLDLAEQLVARELAASQTLHAPDRMIALGDSSMIHEARHQFPEAEADLKTILALAVESTGATSRATADAHSSLGWFYTWYHRWPEAEESYSAALALYGPHDTEQLRRTLFMLGRAYLADSKFDQAEPIWNRAIKLAEETHDADQLSLALANLAIAYQKTNHLAEAEVALTRAMNIAEQLPKPNNRNWAAFAMTAASFYQETGRLQQAEQLYLRIVAFMEREMGPDVAPLRVPLDGLIGLLKSQGRLAESSKYEARRDQLPEMPKLPGVDQ